MEVGSCYVSTQQISPVCVASSDRHYYQALAMIPYQWEANLQEAGHSLRKNVETMNT